MKGKPKNKEKPKISDYIILGRGILPEYAKIISKEEYDKFSPNGKKPVDLDRVYFYKRGSECGYLSQLISNQVIIHVNNSPKKNTFTISKIFKTSRKQIIKNLEEKLTELNSQLEFFKSQED